MHPEAAKRAAAWIRAGGWQLDDTSLRDTLERHFGANGEVDELVSLADECRDRETEPSATPQTHAATPRPAQATGLDRAIDGATFILREPLEIPSLWGERDQVIWAAGEALMIVGPDGVGKTTLAQQLVLARVGVRDSTFLGLPVARTGSRVLYIAADRPRQAARSLGRMVGHGDHQPLQERLVVWPGPLPFDLTDDPRHLAAFARALNADTIVIDSLKDVALDLVDDGVGSRTNLAFQEVNAAGIELCVLHHQRKAQGDNKKPKQLADVYGSRWLTAGMGSVICLWGQPGDLVVELAHLKQPAEEVGPHNIVHDHAHGRTSIHEGTTLEEILAASGVGGITAQDAARSLFETSDKPPANLVEKARRRLEKLVERGHAEKRGALDGSTRYSLRDESSREARVTHREAPHDTDTHHTEPHG